MNNKGQFITLEQLLYFGIGMTILIATIGGFRFVGNGVEVFSREDQFREVGELVLTNAQNAYIQGTNLNSTYELTFEVPKTITDTSYRMEFVDNKELLILSLSNLRDNQTLSLIGLNETTVFEGNSNSIRGSVRIKYNPNENIISIENP